ncbi:MAG: response regulator [Spirulina sp. DLM2.Bin59]|nr:MAG: response regulator [Spirulina sp. DLM2.Bin59]
MNRPAIVCVDDELIILQSLRDELRNNLAADFTIELADSGHSALELVKELIEEGYHLPLIISDYIMPDMRGDELLAKIHQLSPQTLKVMLTGQATVEAVSHAIQHAKLYRYMAKPWESEDLKLTVSEALNAYQQTQKLAAQHQELLKLNQALEEANLSLEQRVAERTQELSQALESLQMAQESLIQSEKMAALGQLVAGVAHEINTPMGAIRASIGSLNTALGRSLSDLPLLFRTLSEERWADFQHLLTITANHQDILISRQERKARRRLTTILTNHGLEQAEDLAMRLILLGITDEVEPLLPLLRSEDCDLVLNTVYTLAIQRNSGKRIQLAVEKATQIVSALKSYARQSNSTEMTETDLCKNIDLVLTIYHNSLKQGIEVKKDYNKVPLIPCYPDELTQVWTNLIHNAIHAMDGHGEMTIQLQQVDTSIVVKFTDTGCGIPPDLQSKIFDPFFTTKAVGEGSGMGLSIVQRIIERHRGQIRVESQPSGTTFTIVLPLPSRA